MYAQTAVKRNSIPRNGAYRIVNRDVHFCTPPCSSLRSKNYTSLCRITLDTVIDRKDSEKRQFNWSAIKVASALLVIGVGAAVGALGGDFKIKLPNKK